MRNILYMCLCVFVLFSVRKLLDYGWYSNAFSTHIFSERKVLLQLNAMIYPCDFVMDSGIVFTFYSHVVILLHTKRSLIVQKTKQTKKHNISLMPLFSEMDRDR